MNERVGDVAPCLIEDAAVGTLGYLHARCAFFLIIVLDIRYPESFHLLEGQLDTLEQMERDAARFEIHDFRLKCYTAWFAGARHKIS
jgi:hypothetical protein